MQARLNSLLLYVQDPASSADFYGKLGFDVENKADSCLVHIGEFTLQCFDQAKVHFKQDSAVGPKGVGVFVYLQVEDVDEIYQQAVSVGLQPSSEPKDWDWGNREFAIKDPDGYKLVFYKPHNQVI